MIQPATRMLLTLIAMLLLGWGVSLRAEEIDDKPVDLLTLAKGAVLVSASVDPTRALALTDGDATSNWNTSTKKNPPPYVFVFELMAETQLTHVGIDGAGQRPGGVAGGSARSVLVEGSAEAADSGYVELATIEAEPEGVTLGAVSPEAKPVRWLRFTVQGPQSDAAWVYFDEVIAYGAQETPEEEGRFSGIFQSGRVDFIELRQDGLGISGCYTENSGRSSGNITGSVVDGVALVNWTSDQGVTGRALLTMDSTGALAGVRYRHRSRMAWGGPVAPEGASTKCSQPAENPIAEALLEAGEVVIYGILFEYDSDVPKASSAAALRQLLEALQGAPDLAVDIEGHTDADGDDAYNLALSDRRAASVVSWLVENGIAAERLQAVGKGEAEPVASNDTADGKALNRRVEVKRR